MKSNLSSNKIFPDMRYIIRDEVEASLPSDWEDTVKSAKKFVADKLAEASAKATSKGLSPAKREAFLVRVRALAISNQGAKTWRTLAATLAAHSSKKCWYCETLQTRSDKAVDHFRPKNQVEGCPDHPGYHWLAFDWTNYRYSCTFCNSLRISLTSSPGGKQCRFPIFDETKRAKCETDNWESEEPELLDPFVRLDTKAITFLDNGQPWPVSSDAQSREYKKVMTSIDVYHLDERDINADRKRIMMFIRKMVKQIDKAPDNSESLKDEILRLIRPSAPYSSAARIYLRFYRGRPWVQDLLEHM